MQLDSRTSRRLQYNSNVKLFYGVSDRGVWSLGSNLILKERSANVPNFDAANIRFLKGNIPETLTRLLPQIVEEWNEENGRYFMITRRVPGKSLCEVWGSMSGDGRERVAKQTAEFLMQLRGLHSSKMQSVAFFFAGDFDTPYGPMSSDDDLWTEVSAALKDIPENVRQRLRERMPSAAPYTFTHGDLASVSIIVDDKGDFSGILDWEASGFYPVWWEFVCAGIGLGQEDLEWKTLLQKYMSEHTEARDFWLDYHALSRFPDLNERGVALLKDGEKMPEEVDDVGMFR